MKMISRKDSIRIKNKLLLILMVVMVLFSPIANFAQAPGLGEVSGFALFTTKGEFTNTGTTFITGDIGTNEGALTGFPPGILVGASQSYVADTTTAHAAIDLGIANGYINALTYDTTIGITLGNNQILPPKIYYLGAASTLNDTLYLDAQGDANALFIFKINGALNTNTYSQVILINSATWNNVYWQVIGTFILGDSSVFAGTVLGTGAITLNTGATLNGRGLTTNGAIHTTALTMNSSFNYPLPVKLVSFNAGKCDEKICVNLSWQTASEFNSAYFLIERSTDGIIFKAIAKRETSGNSTELKSYFYTDQNPVMGMNYYRLNQFDLNGTHQHSLIKAVLISNPFFEINFYPNPFANSIKIDAHNASEINRYEFRIYDGSGAEVLYIIITKPITTIETNLLSPGIYFYTFVGNTICTQTGKLVSQK
jgi:hypothetical protein